MESPFDVLVIGGGPAGLSVGASTVRQAHSTLILDSGKYRNAGSNHMHTVPTWDHRHPSEYREAAKKDFARYGTVKVEDAEVASVKSNADGLFEATGTAGQVWTGRKLVLATGVVDVFPDIEGYADCWISGIFHCLYCHGWEVRGVKSSAILCEGEIAASAVISMLVARQALRLSEEVTMYTHGNTALADDINSNIGPIAQGNMKADPRVIKKFVKGPNGSDVIFHFEDGTTKTEGFIAHKPKCVQRSPFAEQLGLEMTPQGTIKVNPPFNQTSMKGVFAAGDAANPMQTVTQAIFSGTACGGGAPLQLQAEMFEQKGLF